MSGSCRLAAGSSLYFVITEPAPTRCSHFPLLSQKVTLDAVDTRKPGVLRYRVQNVVIKKHHLVIMSLLYHPLWWRHSLSLPQLALQTFSPQIKAECVSGTLPYRTSETPHDLGVEGLLVGCDVRTGKVYSRSGDICSIANERLLGSVSDHRRK